MNGAQQRRPVFVVKRNYDARFRQNAVIFLILTTANNYHANTMHIVTESERECN